MIRSSPLSVVALMLGAINPFNLSLWVSARSTQSTGQVRGKIEAVNGGVVADAKVVVEGEGVMREVVTDEAGIYEIESQRVHIESRYRESGSVLDAAPRFDCRQTPL